MTGQNDAEPARSPIRMVSIDELMPSARSQTEPSAKATPDVADNQRWHDILLGFIDDPRGSVAEAADLVEADVTALIALLSRRRDAMAQSWQAEKSSRGGLPPPRTSGSRCAATATSPGRSRQPEGAQLGRPPYAA